MFFVDEPIERLERIGKFRISRERLRNNWRDVLPLFAHVVVLRAEAFHVQDWIEYVAVSDDFELNDVTIDPPLYVAEMSSKDGNYVFVGFKRVK